MLIKVPRRVVAAVAAAFVLCHAPVLWCAGTEGDEPVRDSEMIIGVTAEPVPFFDQTAAFPADAGETLAAGSAGAGR